MSLSFLQIVMLSSFSLLTASAQLLFKKASGTLPPLNSLSAIIPFVTNIWLIGAIILNLVAIVLWVIVLQKIPLSVAYPFAALAFVIVPFFSWAVYGENVNMAHIIGTALILAGIAVISLKAVYGAS